MVRTLIAGLALGLAGLGHASAENANVERVALPDEQHPLYLQIIVKACPQSETPLEPTNQGKSHDNEKPLSADERKAALAAQGCIDVPIPMEFVSTEMTPRACRGQAGYLAAMQFLQQRQDLARLSAVGAWQCLVTDHQVVGAVSQ